MEHVPTLSDDASAEELRHAAERAERLFEINVQLSATRDPDALLRSIIETAADVLECEAASVLLHKEKTSRLRFVAATGADVDELADVPVPLDDSLAGTIFTENRPLVVGDVSETARHYEPPSQTVSFDARSLVGVPLRLEGNPIGVLEGLNKKNGGFDEEDVRTLSIIAAQAAVAIRNASQMQALEEANDRLSRLDELKSDFLSIASHELRTPLSSILGFGELLEDELRDADETLTEPVEKVMEGARRMKKVVNAMMHMASLRSGATALDTRPVFLQDVLRRACDDTTAEDAARRERLTLTLPDDTLTVDAEPDRLELAVENLLENAFQFSPEGGPVEVRATRVGDEAHVTVRDEGVGLSEEETERIFEDFHQVEEALTRTHGGLGLGLTIARELARLHGGRLHAESPGRGRGATLHLHLPLV